MSMQGAHLVGSKRARGLAGVVLLLVLGGPAPGSVGACGEDSELVEPVGYCKRREQIICARQLARGEVDRIGYETCVLEAQAVCERRIFAPECRPTQRQADACLRALRSTETLQTPADQVEECSTEALCRSRTRDAGAEA